ncbi:MAG: hypothetical protein LBK53_01550 [Heliobacteriaceae bacterium]|nr:hypothetical protein [Heliobacteriaceae bacterium]
MEELFKNGCFLPDWSGLDEVEPAAVKSTEIYVRKTLPELLTELEQIEARIEDIKAREWRLAWLMEQHNNG